MLFLVANAESYMRWKALISKVGSMDGETEAAEKRRDVTQDGFRDHQRDFMTASILHAVLRKRERARERSDRDASL